MAVDLLDSGDDDAPPGRRRWALTVLGVVGVAAAVWVPSRLDARPSGQPPSLRLSVEGFSTSGTLAQVDYTVTNSGRRPVRLLDVALDHDAAETTAVRLPPDDLGVGESAGVHLHVRFACADAETRPLRPQLRLTAETRDGERHVVAPGPGSDLALDAGGGSLLTGPLRAPCSACVDVLDVLAPVDAQAHAADRRAAARAVVDGRPVVVPPVVAQAERRIRAVQQELPADQRALAVTALGALADLGGDERTWDSSFAVLDQVRDDLEELCDPAVPEVLR